MNEAKSFPLNAWYVAAWDHEVKHQLLPRRICEVAIVMYRRNDGGVAALEDACWHRLLPLSKGYLRDEEVVCGYHGLVFNAQGRCTEMPSQETLNPSACVRSFPVCERDRFVWIWMGNPALADTDLIPDLFQNSDSAWAGDGGVTYLKCDYRLLVDNLMDLTHETFVHSSSIGNRAVAEAPFTVSHTEDHARVTRWMIDIDPPPFFRAQLKEATKVDRWQVVTCYPPSTVTIDVGVAPTGTGAPEGDRSKGLTGFVIHTSTPETDRTTHYFWAFLRNYDLGSQRLTTEWREAARSIFGEDKDILEAQQVAVDEHPGREFYYLNIDGGAMWARRLIQKKIEQELGSSAQSQRVIPVKVSL
ncbi:aromatic ring-hydroxylating dioxygenase subunit alpha [Paraburkholderia sediminicola]|uniref:aromatic ring-hydroxylating dioxygenase subunit alpha n=1 Tax=Paraburkholderia sediminicola TaxID=458836 RepID=UPI0038B8BE0B